jgi:hypothetical protein
VRAFLTRRPKSAHCLSAPQLVGWPRGAKPETPRGAWAGTAHPGASAGVNCLQDGVHSLGCFSRDLNVRRRSTAGVQIRVPVQIAASALNYDRRLRELPGAGNLEQERPQEHHAASGRSARTLWGLLVVRERSLTGTDPSGRFSGPLATAAIFLRHPLRRPPRTRQGRGVQRHCRRRGGGENPFGDPRPPLGAP